MDPNKQNGDPKPGNVIKPDNSNSDTEAMNTDTQAAPQEAKQASPNVVEPTNDANSPTDTNSAPRAEAAPQPGTESSSGPVQTPANQDGDKASVASFAVPKKKGGSKKLIFSGLAAVVVAVLLGVGAYAYMEYNKPENRMKRALGEIMGSEAGDYSLETSISGSTADSPISASVDIGGDFAYNSEASRGSVDLSLPMGMGNPVVEFVSTADPVVFYVKADGISDSGLTSFLGDSEEIQEFIDTYEGEWIQADEGDLPEEYSETEALNYELTDEDKEKLESIITNSQAFTVGESLGEKDLEDGTTAEGFAVTLNPEGVADIIRAIGEADLNIIRQINEDTQVDVDFDQVADDAQSELETFNEEEDVSFEVWLDGSSFKQFVVEGPIEDDSDFTVAITVNNLNDDVEIEVPAEAIEFDQVRQDYEALMEAQQQYQQQFNQFESAGGGSSSSDFQFDASDDSSTFEFEGGASFQ